MHKPRKSSLRLLQKIVFLFILLQSCLVFSQERSKLDSIGSLFTQTSNDSLKVVHEIELSRELHRKKHAETEEFAFAEDAVERALQLNDTLLYAKALDNFGLLYRFHRYYDESLALHKKAFELVKNTNFPAIYKMIFANNAGVAARYNQKYDTAVSYYMMALKIAEKENDFKNIAISSNGIGNALGSMPNRENEALQYFERSLKAEKKIGNTLGMAMNYLSISDYYIEKKDYKKARSYLNKLLRINRKRKDQYGLAITYEFMGICALKEGKDLEKAESYFKNALSRFRAMNNHHKESEVLASLGDVKLKQNQLEPAEDYYRESIALAEKFHQNGLIEKNALRLSKILEDKNMPQKALDYYKQGKAYGDSIKITEQNVKIEALTKKYDLAKKESHIQLLQKDKALQQTKLNSQKNQLDRRSIIMVLMGIGILFILIVFLLQYRNYRTKKKTTARIQKEEKEKMNAIYERNLAKAETIVTRLRINPHFLFNSLNAITYLIQSEQNMKAIKYLKVFSRYTRMVLETSTKHVIPLREELKLADYYLMLEENRFEKDLTFHIIGDDTPEIEGTKIPPLLLQPFLENAIWHGLLPSKCAEKILKILIEPYEKGIKISIDDNGVGRKSKGKQDPRKTHKSMGMDIIKERIDLFNKSYDGKINFTIIDKKDENGKPMGTRIVFDLLQKPYIDNEKTTSDKT